MQNTQPRSKYLDQNKFILKQNDVVISGREYYEVAFLLAKMCKAIVTGSHIK